MTLDITETSFAKSDHIMSINNILFDIISSIVSLSSADSVKTSLLTNDQTTLIEKILVTVIPHNNVIMIFHELKSS